MSIESQELRLVEDLAKVQRKKLRANSHKPHWGTATNATLLKCLLDEVGELVEACMEGDPSAIVDECADVANFAAMIRDNATLF